MLQEKLQKSFNENGGKVAPVQVKEDFKKLSEELGNLKQTGDVLCQYSESEKMIDIDIVLDSEHNKKLSISRYFDLDPAEVDDDDIYKDLKEYLDNEIVTFSIYNGPGLSKLVTSGEMEITQLINRINNGEF